MVTKREANGAGLKQAEDRQTSPVTGSGSSTPKSSPGDQKIKFGNFSDVTVGTFSGDEDVPSTPIKELGPGLYSPSDFQRRYKKSSNESLASGMTMSYSRDTDGNFKPTDWQKIRRSDKSWLPFETINYKRKGRVFSISSVQRDLSPMTEKTFKRIVELDVPNKYIYSGGQDGTTEDSEAVLHCSEVAAESAAAGKKDSCDDGIPVEGEMVKQVVHEAGESEDFEPDEIRMTIEQDTLFICFPGNIRGDAVGMFIPPFVPST